jgi:hypothetical protein
MRFFPKDEIFYDLFEKQAEKLMQAGRLLDEILASPQNLKEAAVKMKKLEVEADALGHNVVDNLRKSFITPIERDDIDLLRQRLDDIMDCIEKAVNRLVIYQTKTPFPKEIEDYIKFLKLAIEEINLGVKEIRNVKKFQENIHRRCQKLNELEDMGDIVNRTALKNLMSVSQPNPEKILEIMKLKEIYELLEDSIDFCEDVGNIFEGILIKNL